MLSRAVSSVLRQSLQDFELIIIDDGSSQPYDPDLLADPRVQIIRNPASLGVAHARNLGVNAARGTYISFLDDDDEYLDSFLSSTYARLKDTPDDVGISWCGVKQLDYSPVGCPSERNIEFPVYDDRSATIADLFSIGLSFGFTAKAECLKKVGPFDCALKVASDTDYFFRILTKSFVPVVVPGVHIVRHIHLGARLTASGLHKERIRIWEEWLLVQYSGFLRQYPELDGGLRGYVDSLKKELGDAESPEQNRYIRSTPQIRFPSRFFIFRDWFARLAH
jgi:glycosyltransferase involved in cell wall biosynthesis